MSELGYDSPMPRLARAHRVGASLIGIALLGCAPMEPRGCPSPWPEPSLSGEAKLTLTQLPDSYLIAHLGGLGGLGLKELEYEYETLVENVVAASSTLEDEAAAVAFQKQWLTPLQEAYARGLDTAHAQALAAEDDIAWQLTEMRLRMQSHPSWYGPRFDAREQLERESDRQLADHRARLDEGGWGPTPQTCIAADLSLDPQELVDHATWHFAPDARVRVGCRFSDSVSKMVESHRAPSLSALVQVEGPALEPRTGLIRRKREIAIETRNYIDGDYVELSLDLADLTDGIEHGYGRVFVMLSFERILYATWDNAKNAALFRFSFG